MYMHIVMWKLKEGLAEGVREEMADKLRSLKSQLDELVELEVGINTLKSEAAYDLSLTTSFENETAYRAYAVDPLHQEVVAWIRDRVSERAVVDYHVDR